MKSAWKYSRGRPRHGWINNIKNKMWAFILDTQHSGWGPVLFLVNTVFCLL